MTHAVAEHDLRLRDANRFVIANHRHHGPVQGPG